MATTYLPTLEYKGCMLSSHSDPQRSFPPSPHEDAGIRPPERHGTHCPIAASQSRLIVGSAGGPHGVPPRWNWKRRSQSLQVPSSMQLHPLRNVLRSPHSPKIPLTLTHSSPSPSSSSRPSTHTTIRPYDHTNTYTHTHPFDAAEGIHSYRLACSQHLSSIRIMIVTLSRSILTPSPPPRDWLLLHNANAGWTHGGPGESMRP